MTFRKEIKYQLSKTNLEILKDHLLKDGMEILYPTRIVKSIYFDSKDLKIFFESENGLMPRYKFRIRSYNDKKIFFQEIKVTSVEGRFKTSNKISINDFSELKKTGKLFKRYGKIKPSIEIQYMRDYFMYKNCRITFDYNIIYRSCRSLFGKIYKDNFNVMELKASINKDTSNIENSYCLQPSNFSKYLRGVSMCGLLYSET
jgi:adenylate cyclase class IV